MDTHDIIMAGNALAGSVVAKALIEKVAEALTGLAKPWQTRRISDADAYAAIRKASASAEAGAVEERALNRMIAEESRRQGNMEAILREATKGLLDDAQPQSMSNDWISSFFEKGRIVSDEEMQSVWASVLSGEANRPGSFSKRTLSLLSDIEKTDAASFEVVCSLGVRVLVVSRDGRERHVVDERSPMIRRADLTEFYDERGLTWPVIHHLCNLGLIEQAPLDFQVKRIPDAYLYLFELGETSLRLKMKPEANAGFVSEEARVGNIRFTKFGAELARVCKVKPDKRLLPLLAPIWRKEGYLYEGEDQG